MLKFDGHSHNDGARIPRTHKVKGRVASENAEKKWQGHVSQQRARRLANYLAQVKPKSERLKNVRMPSRLESSDCTVRRPQNEAPNSEFL